MKITDLTPTQLEAQSLNIHQGAFSTGLKGKLLSDLTDEVCDCEDCDNRLTIQDLAISLANEEFEDGEMDEMDYEFALARIEADLLDCPIDGYSEISSIFISRERDANEMIDFLEGGTITQSEIDDFSFGEWQAPPCDSAARGLFWDLRTPEMENENKWVVAYLKDKIANDLF